MLVKLSNQSLLTQFANKASTDDSSLVDAATSKRSFLDRPQCTGPRTPTYWRSDSRQPLHTNLLKR